MRAHWAFVGIWDVFYAAHYFRFQSLALFYQFADTFGIGVRQRRQALQIAGLAAGSGLQVAVFGRGNLGDLANSGAAVADAGFAALFFRTRQLLRAGFLGF